MWTELIWLKTGSVTACEYGNYPSSFIQKKHLLKIWGRCVFFFKDPVSCRMIYYMNAQFHKHRVSYGSPSNYKLLWTAHQLHQMLRGRKWQKNRKSA
jgi:hypothetical protein